MARYQQYQYHKDQEIKRKIKGNMKKIKKDSKGQMISKDTTTIGSRICFEVPNEILYLIFSFLGPFELLKVSTLFN